ncbi:MAG: hypothetical protein PHX83_11440 [Acidobacteriia bacterium]|nr:hypothetical protein [Terriglobia bacterium]
MGSYHKRFPETEEGDRQAWGQMLAEMEAARWDNLICESTGLNDRWKEVFSRCPQDGFVTFKLECRRKELLRRIALKSPEDRTHGDWWPPSLFHSKIEFVESVYDDFRSRTAECVLDTTRASCDEVFNLATRYLSARWRKP